MEDLGYYCVDNLPLTLIEQLLATLQSSCDKVAISIDMRNLHDDESALEQRIRQLRQLYACSVFYFDCSTEVLLRRYSETRRLHPLAAQSSSLQAAIEYEPQLLAPIAKLADLRVDSSEFSVHQLAEVVRERVLGKPEQQLVMVFESFGFKHGLPKDADYVFDVRFLPNPHWQAELKPLTGLDKPVIDYLAAQDSVQRFIAQITQLFDYWLPDLERNNRSYLTIAIGCTGGQHRSVYIAECLAAHFRAQGKTVQSRHRTLEKRVL